MRALRWALAALMAAGAVWITIDMLNEAYGPGPPYYGLSTNMDKWTSPWFALVAIDALVLLIVGTLLTTWRGSADERR